MERAEWLKLPAPLKRLSASKKNLNDYLKKLCTAKTVGTGITQEFDRNVYGKEELKPGILLEHVFGWVYKKT